MSPAIFRLGQWLVFSVLAMMVAAAVVCAGCGASTPQDIAQTAMTATARGLTAADEVTAERYTAKSEEALEAVETMAGYRTVMRPLDRAEAALRGARTTLLAAQAALNVWVATGDSASFMRVVKCLAGELDLLNDTLEAAGVDVPDALSAVLDIGATYGRAMCRESEVTP